MSEVRHVLMPHLERLLSSREHPKTICPSEVARSLNSAELNRAGTSNWRSLMPEVRQVISEMRKRGEVEVLQKGEVVPNTIPVDDIKGPIRARKCVS